MGNCSSTSNCNPCGPSYDAINLLATKAGSYARQANAYAISSENAFLEFNAWYLGPFATAPTVDNKGEQLQLGALYWNTVLNAMFIWNGLSWVNSNVQGGARWGYTGDGVETEFDITGAISTFSTSYLVTIDGVVQDPNNYTIAGTILTMSTAIPSGSVIVIVSL